MEYVRLVKYEYVLMFVGVAAHSHMVEMVLLGMSRGMDAVWACRIAVRRSGYFDASQGHRTTKA